MVYIEGVDSTSHLFGHLFRRSELSGALAEQGRRYGRAVEEMYRYADEIVGAYLDALDDDTTLVVLSDHGFELGVLHEDPSRARDMRRVSERFHRIEGILYLYGNRVRAGRRLEKPAICSTSRPRCSRWPACRPPPTCRGACSPRASTCRRSSTATPRSVASYETPARRGGAAGRSEGRRRRLARDPRAPARARLPRRELSQGRSQPGGAPLREGRVRGGGAPLRGAGAREPRRRGPAREPTRARSGRSESSTRRYAELGRAIALEPANPEAYHNRGAILEKRGDPKGAAREYQTALRYAPDYEPSRSALARLGGGAAAGDEPQTANEKLATALAEQAHQAALRDDFAGATKKLDEAERIAPRFALVAHYRANIAYLQGDRAGAIKALKPRRRARARQSAVSDESRAAGKDRAEPRPSPDAQRITALSLMPFAAYALRRRS